MIVQFTARHAPERTPIPCVSRASQIESSKAQRGLQRARIAVATQPSIFVRYTCLESCCDDGTFALLGRLPEFLASAFKATLNTQ